MKYIISESLPIPATVVQDIAPPPASDVIVNDVPLGIKPLFPEETVHVPLDVNPDIK